MQERKREFTREMHHTCEGREEMRVHLRKKRKRMSMNQCVFSFKE
jgi:hypothetical protein